MYKYMAELFILLFISGCSSSIYCSKHTSGWRWNC
jgi:hypothetical protein